MRILVVNPFGDTEFYGQENLARIARPDTEFEMVNIADMYPLRNNQWLYFRYMCTDATLEKSAMRPTGRDPCIEWNVVHAPDSLANVARLASVESATIGHTTSNMVTLIVRVVGGGCSFGQ